MTQWQISEIKESKNLPMTHASFSWNFANCVEEEVICRRQFVCQQPRKMFVLTVLILLTCLCLFWKPIFWPWPCQGNTFSCLSILQVKLSQTILLFFIWVRNTSKYFSVTSIDFFCFKSVGSEGAAIDVKLILQPFHVNLV